jgi:hypothetical protein
MTAARSPPRSEPANRHDFLPSAMPRNTRLGCVVAETNARNSATGSDHRLMAKPINGK